jgi:rRNA biogenesis protein RRP36
MMEAASSSSSSSSSEDSDEDRHQAKKEVVRSSGTPSWSAPRPLPPRRRQKDEEENNNNKKRNVPEDDDDDDEQDEEDSSSSSVHSDGPELEEEASTRNNSSSIRSSNTLTLEQRLQQQEHRGGGAMRRTTTTNQQQENQHEKNKKNKKKKPSSKHAPTEVSSRRRAYFDLNANGNAISFASYKPCDPRHSSLHGHLTEETFEDHYAFVHEMRQKEMIVLEQRIKAHGMGGKKGQEKRHKLGISSSSSYQLQEDMTTLQRLQDESRQLERGQMERAAQKTVREKFRPTTTTGPSSSTKIFHPKRRIIKESLRAARMDELRKRKGDGAVQKSLEKRRKREKSKDANMQIK